MDNLNFNEAEFEEIVKDGETFETETITAEETEAEETEFKAEAETETETENFKQQDFEFEDKEQPTTEEIISTYLGNPKVMVFMIDQILVNVCLLTSKALKVKAKRADFTASEPEKKQIEIALTEYLEENPIKLTPQQAFFGIIGLTYGGRLVQVVAEEKSKNLENKKTKTNEEAETNPTKKGRGRPKKTD